MEMPSQMKSRQLRLWMVLLHLNNGPTFIWKTPKRTGSFKPIHETEFVRGTDSPCPMPSFLTPTPSLGVETPTTVWVFQPGLIERNAHREHVVVHESYEHGEAHLSQHIPGHVGWL